MTLADKIIAARKQLGLTQEDLAALTNITVRTIQRIESGESTPRPFTLKAMANALQKPYEYFIGEEGITGDPSTQEQAASGQPRSAPAPAGCSRDMIHFLQMLNLSCFSYIPIPFVHFLIPLYLLKKKKGLSSQAIAFGRKIVLRQVYWLIITHLLLLGTLIFNQIQFSVFHSRQFLSYMSPVIIMYTLNAALIFITDARIRKMNVPTTDASSH